MARVTAPADRQIAKGVWVPGKLELQGDTHLGILCWEATGLEDPLVRAKLEEQLPAGAAESGGAGGGEGEGSAGMFHLEINLEDVVGSPQVSKPPTKPLMRISVHKRGGKAKSSFVFRFLTDDSRDTIIDVIQPLLAKLRKSGQRPGGKDDPFASISGSHVQAKRNLLRKNTELGELYKQVVNSGAVTDQEFWNTKRKLLEQEMSVKQTQKRGVSTSMLADVELTNDGNNFVINFKLTDETKKLIFAEKPKVHKAFLENVPSKLSEKEFWTKYCKHLYYQKVNNKRKRGKTLKSANAIQRAEEMEAVQELFAENDEDLRSNEAMQKKKMSKLRNQAINLMTDYHDGFSVGYGLRHNAAGVIKDTSHLQTKSLVKDLNRHAAVVVRGGSLSENSGKLDASRGQPGCSNRDQQLDDLVVKPSQEGYETLKIQQLQQSNGAGVNVRKETARQLLEQVKDASVRMPLTSAGEEKEVLGELARRSMSKGVNWSGGKGSLPEEEEEVMKEMRRKSQAVNELLRHFWASFPLSSEKRVAKAKKIMKVLEDHYQNLQSAGVGRPLIIPLLQACDAAFTYGDQRISNLKNV